jgi:regulator of sigma E protease
MENNWNWFSVQAQEPTKQVGGFKAIFDIFSEYWSWETFWTITALLSIMLGYELIAYSGTRWRSCDVFYYMKLLVVKWQVPWKRTNGWFCITYNTVIICNGNDIYKAIVGK